jgi:hypothetical protein
VSRGRLWAAIAAAVVVVGGGAFAIGEATSSSPHHSGSPTGPATTSTPGATAAPPLVTTAPGVTVAAPPEIPVVACHSSYGVPPQPPSTTIPSAMVLSEPGAVADRLSYFTDRYRVLAPVLGPRGWHCNVEVGVDGSAGIDIYPGSQPSQATQADAGQPQVQTISDGACQGCVFSTVCGFLSAAATNQLGYSGSGLTCAGRPSGETVDWIKGSADAAGPSVADVIGFADPTSPDSTNGVVLYDYTSAGIGGAASADTCVLAAADHGLCTIILNQFINSSWQMLR